MPPDGAKATFFYVRLERHKKRKKTAYWWVFPQITEKNVLKSKVRMTAHVPPWALLFWRAGMHFYLYGVQGQPLFEEIRYVRGVRCFCIDLALLFVSFYPEETVIQFFLYIHKETLEIFLLYSYWNKKNTNLSMFSFPLCTEYSPLLHRGHTLAAMSRGRARTYTRTRTVSFVRSACSSS